MAVEKHGLELVERSKLVVTGVTHVDNYDDKEILLQTQLGTLLIKGEGLNISELNLESGKLNVNGTVNQLSYSDSASKKGKGLLQKILK